jgi:hypothetical protein
VIVSYNSRAGSHSVLHHTPTVSVANDPYRFEAGYCLYLFADFSLAAANRRIKKTGQ